MMDKKLRYEQWRNRRGVLAFAVLACIVIAMLIVLSTVQMSVKIRRQSLIDLRATQADWLFDAAFRHGLSQWHDNPEYTGEKIVIDGERSIVNGSIIKIEMTPQGDPNGSARMVVTVELPRQKQTETVASADASAINPSQRSYIRRSTSIELNRPNAE